jgi:hypothetical protein
LLFGQGQLDRNVFRDNLSADNAALGFGVQIPGGPGATNTTIDRLTLLNNGADAPAADGGRGAQIRLGKGVTQGQITNLCISPAPNGQTQGQPARLRTRYVDGVLTDEPLWPWPMQERAMAELGVDVTAIAQAYIKQVEAACR